MSNPQNPSSIPSNASPRTSDEVFAALADFESGLTNLKQLYAQRQKLVDDILQHEREVATRESELSTRLDEAARVESQLKERRDEIESLRVTLETRQGELAERERALTAQMEEAQNLRQKTQAELVAERERVEQERRAVEQERSSQARLAEEIAAKASSLAERERAYEDALRQAQSASDEASNARREARTSQEELDSVRRMLSESEATVSELRQQLAMTAEQMARAQAQARERSATADSLAGKLKQLQSDLAEARKAQSSAETSSKGASAGMTEMNDKLAAAQRQVQELQSAKAEAENALKALSAEVESRRTGQEAESAKSLAETRARLEAALKDAADADRRAGEADAKFAIAESKLTELDDKYQRAIAALKELKNSAKSAASNSASGLPTGPRGVSVELRRRRLRGYREGLQRQADKIRRAGDAVKRRMEQADEVLKHRADVAMARQRVIEAERRAQRQRAGSRTAVVLMCSLIMLALLGGMSWALARQFAPATFIATAEIKADGRGRDLTLPEMDEWKTFHEQLLSDPRFHETAAERFRRQGSPALGAATAVADLVKNAVTLTSSNPGQMTIALTGQGSAKTERTLEVLTAAWASEANEALQRRVEGSLTQVSQAAKSGPDPIDNTRNIWALAMLGVGVIVTGFIGLVSWSRLANAKTKFEKDSSLDDLLNGENWPDPSAAAPPVKPRKGKDAGGA